MAIDCCNLIIFRVCEAKRPPRRLELLPAEPVPRSPWLALLACHTFQPNDSEAARRCPNVVLTATDFTPVRARARYERLDLRRFIYKLSVNKLLRVRNIRWNLRVVSTSTDLILCRAMCSKNTDFSLSQT